MLGVHCGQHKMGFIDENEQDLVNELKDPDNSDDDDDDKDYDHSTGSIITKEIYEKFLEPNTKRLREKYMPDY